MLYIDASSLQQNNDKYIVLFKNNATLTQGDL